MQQQGGGGQMRQLRQRGQPTGETVLTRWVGHLVVVKYLAGPAMPADPQDPRSLAVSEPEARSGIFHLQRFSQLGIEVSNEMEEGMLNRVVFIPWGAVLSIRGTTQEERAGGGGRLTREQVAEIALCATTSEVERSYQTSIRCDAGQALIHQSECKSRSLKC